MKFSKTQIGLFLALLLGNAIVLFSDLGWTWLRLPTALALTLVLPGWAWLPALGWMQTRCAIERVFLVCGFSSLLSALVLLITVLLPGPFTESPVLIALSLTTFAGLLCQSICASQSKISLQARERNPPTDAPTNSKIKWPSRTVLLILLGILVIATVTRLTRLGYAEFHEDELENMRLIVRAYKGEEFAPFIDSKGPIHWLLPGAVWYFNGWVSEGIARTPFALTSLLLVPTMYALGRRMSGGRESVGLLAAGFVTINGFFIALSRHVENRSLIVFWGALAVWFAYRYYKEDLNHFLLYTALTLSIGLIAHPTVLLYLPAFVFIIGLKVYRDRNWRQRWPWLVGGTALFIGLAALFYVPFLTNPQIGLVYEYFASERIGTSLLYNAVDNMLGEDELYSSRYHGPVVVFLLIWLLARNFAQLGWWGWAIFGGLSLAIVSTVTRPDAWIIGSLNLAFVPYAVLTLIFILLPRTDVETKTLFLWFIAPFGALLFLAEGASNHIQIAYTGWALLSAFALADLWAFLSTPADLVTKMGKVREITSRPPGLRHSDRLTSLKPILKVIIVLVFIFVIPLILYYQYLSFDSTVTTYWQVKRDYTYNPDSIYNFLYGSIPRPRKIISNPRLGGWKAVGYLWEQGTISDDFRSINESFAVPIWYTFQTPRSCYNDPQHYWVRRDWKGWPEEEQKLVEQGYTLTRVILVDQQPKLHLYEKNASPGEPEVLDMEDYRHQFDRLATPARFAQDETIRQPTSLNFGNKLLLYGYDLPQTVRAGELLPVTVYWDTLAPMDIRYRAFVHLIGADDARWGQHDDDPACRLLTTEMRPGQRSTRQFRLPLDPTTPPGEYNVVLGIYHPDTLERLDIWDNLNQQSPGNSLVLGQVRVE